MNKTELSKLEKFLKRRFNQKNLKISFRDQIDDSAEVFIGEESIGVIYRNSDEGELSWDFHMSILEIDLED